jgi:hypothetical protein
MPAQTNKIHPVSTYPTGEIDYQTAHKKYSRSNSNQFQFDGADMPNFKQYHQIKQTLIQFV